MKSLKIFSRGLITIGTLAPIFSVVACSNKQEEIEIEDDDKYVDIKSNPLEMDIVDYKVFQSLKDLAIENGLTKEDINSITIEDLSKFITEDVSLPEEKKDIVEKMKNLLIKWSFENNRNGEQMTELQKWINNSSLSVLTSQSQGRGPWRTETTKGIRDFYRKDLIEMKKVSDFVGYDLVGSLFTKKGLGSYKGNAKGGIVDFNTYGKVDIGKRIFDPTFSVGNTFISTITSATSFSIFRSRKKGNFESETDITTGKITFTSEEEEEVRLFPGLDIYIDNQKVDSQNDFVSYEEALEIAKGKGKKTEITLKTSDKKVNYVQTKGKSIKDTGQQFEAKDLFYGMVRSFYTSSYFRKNSKIDKEGVDLGEYLKKMDEEELDKFDNLFGGDSAIANSYDNGNLYLYELYGIDLEKTVETNINNSNQDEFKIIFKDFSPTSLYMFKNNSAINPFPKSKLIEDDSLGDSKLSATRLNIFEYGNPYPGTGPNNIENVYSIAPFLYTNYSTSEGEKITIKQNHKYIDRDWVNDPRSIKYYSTKMKTGIDADAFASQRVNQFKDASRTNEYILDLSVYNYKNYINDLYQYSKLKKPVQKGQSSANKLYWNYAGFKDEYFNEKGREMMWGKSSLNEIATDPKAMREFFSGSGAILRNSLNSAINFYAMAQLLFPKQNVTFYPSTAFEEEFKVSNVDKKFILSKTMQSIDDLEKIYKSNFGDWQKAWKTDNYVQAAKTIDDLAKSVNATKENPAQIPIFTYIFVDAKPTSIQEKANKNVLTILNSLTPRVKFVNQKSIEWYWSDFLDRAYTKKDAATILGGYGADYNGLGSINQQFLTYYASAGFVGLFQDVFNDE